MSLFYEDEVCKVYNSNMEDIINNLEYDLIITDPPYNIDYKYPDYKDKTNEEEYISLFKHFKNKPCVVIHYPEAICNYVCKGIGSVNKIISWCYSNNNSSKAHRSIGFFNIIPDFKKVKQPYKNLNDRRIKKLIEKGSEGARLYDWFNDIELVKNVSKEKIKGFTNQIPIKLLERIILLTTEEGDTILDTFFGSGSLYFACKNTNRKCIGIEQSNIHLNYFLERLKSI